MSKPDLTRIAAQARQEVRISGWQEDEITVVMKRPGLYAMAAGGRIPNPLLKTADALFMRNGSAIQSCGVEDIAKTMLLIAREALVSPSLEEITAAGLELTDQQMQEIYSFAIGGAAALDRFRGGKRRAVGGDEQHDAHEGEQPVGH